MTQPLSRRRSKAHFPADDHFDNTADMAFVFANTPLDPVALFNEVELDPIKVALSCQRGLEILERGSQKQRRLYIAVGFKAATHIGRSDDLLVKFDRLLVEQGILRKSSLDETRARLIYRMMELMFHTSGLTTSNTAYRYAHGLYNYFTSFLSVESVAAIIIDRGPELLYKEEVKRRQTDRAIANSLHERHIDRLMRDGRYALDILGIDATSAVELASDASNMASGEVPADIVDDDESMFDDDDDEEVAQPSWRRQEITRIFEKLLTTATQMSAEIVESKAMLDNELDDNGFHPDLLKEMIDIEREKEYKTEEIALVYEQALKYSVRLNNELVQLKALLERSVA